MISKRSAKKALVYGSLSLLLAQTLGCQGDDSAESSKKPSGQTVQIEPTPGAPASSDTAAGGSTTTVVSPVPAIPAPNPVTDTVPESPLAPTPAENPTPVGAPSPVATVLPPPVAVTPADPETPVVPVTPVTPPVANGTPILFPDSPNLPPAAVMFNCKGISTPHSKDSFFAWNVNQAFAMVEKSSQKFIQSDLFGYAKSAQESIAAAANFGLVDPYDLCAYGSDQAWMERTFDAYGFPEKSTDKAYLQLNSALAHFSKALQVTSTDGSAADQIKDNVNTAVYHLGKSIFYLTQSCDPYEANGIFLSRNGQDMDKFQYQTWMSKNKSHWPLMTWNQNANLPVSYFQLKSKIIQLAAECSAIAKPGYALFQDDATRGFVARDIALVTQKVTSDFLNQVFTMLSDKENAGTYRLHALLRLGRDLDRKTEFLFKMIEQDQEKNPPAGMEAAVRAIQNKADELEQKAKEIKQSLSY